MMIRKLIIIIVSWSLRWYIISIIDIDIIVVVVVIIIIICVSENGVYPSGFR